MPFIPLSDDVQPIEPTKVYNAPPLSGENLTIEQGDFDVPEFKQVSEIKNIPTGENFDAMGSPSKEGSYKFVPLAEAKPKFVPLEENIQTKNWAGTGPAMSATEYFKSGFLGRHLTNAFNSEEEIRKQANDNVLKAYPEVKDDSRLYRKLYSAEYKRILLENEKKTAAEKAANPEPSTLESLKELGKSIIDNPVQAAKGFIYEFGKDPEFLLLGGGAGAVKSVASAAKGAKTVTAVKGIATTTAKAGALGATAEGLAETGSREGYDLQKIGNTAAAFGTLGAVTKSAGEGFKAAKGVKAPTVDIDKLNTDLAQVEDLLSKPTTTFPEKINDIPVEKGVVTDPVTGEPITSQKGTPKLGMVFRDEQGTPTKIVVDEEAARRKWDVYQQRAEEQGVNNPLTKVSGAKNADEYVQFVLAHEEGHTLVSKPDFVSYADHEALINEMARERLNRDVDSEITNNPSLVESGDVFKDDSVTDQNPVEAIRRTIAHTILNTRAARIWRQSIEKAIPDQRVRERVTMAIEGEKPYDRLLTDAEKRQTLYGDSAEVIKQKKLRNEKPDIGLKGALNLYNDFAENRLEPRAYDTFWNNFIKRNRIESLSFEEQKTFFEKKRSSLNYAVDKLMSLPSEEHAFDMLKQIQKNFAQIGEQAKREGLMEHLRDNYVPHLLDFSDSILSKTAQQTLRDRINGVMRSPRFNRDFTKQRTYEFIRDLEKVLHETGKELNLDTSGVKVQRDIARIAEVYQQAMGEAIVEKRVINFLEKQKAEGVLGDSEGLLTKNFKFGFENGYVKFTGHGSEALKDYLVHPDLVDPLNFLFLQKDPIQALRAGAAISNLSKAITTTASLFHAVSLAWAKATAAPLNFAKEVLSGFSGTRAALTQLKEGGNEYMIKIMTEAGMRFELEEISRSALSEVAKSLDNTMTEMFTDKDVKVLRKVVDPVDALVLQNLNWFTWDFMHAAGKFQTANYLFTKIKVRHPELEDRVIAKEVSNFINNTFGGVDWLDLANRVKTPWLKQVAMKAYGNRGKPWMQIMMFAPDWTVATLRSYTRALPEYMFEPKRWEIKKGFKDFFDPKTEGDLARRYLFTTGVIWATMLNQINLATSGHNIWENEDPTRIDMGDGTSMQMAKHSMEGMHWLMHPVRTATNKLGYIPKTAVNLASPYVRTPMDVAKVMADPFVPFQVSAAADAPTGEKVKRGLFSFVGMPIYGKTDKAHTSIQDRLARKQERKEQLREAKKRKLGSK